MVATASHRRIDAELERRRTAARASLEERRAHAFGLCPALEELDRGMAHAGLEASRKLVAGEMAPDDARAALESEASSFVGRRSKLLEQAGLPPGYLDLAPSCALCGDTGLVRGDGPASGQVACPCVRRMLADELYEISNLRAAGPAGFDLFDGGLYSGEPDAAKYGYAESPKDNILDIFGSAQRYVQSLLGGEGEDLYFFGRPGTGKTFMAAAIAREAVRGGVAALYQTAPSLFGAITEHRMRQYRDEQYSDERYQRIFRANLLVIDDLGTESMTDARYAEFITLLNSRLASSAPRLSTIIVTNMDLHALRDAYDERITSRIMGSFRIVPFFGDDIRLAKNERG